MFPILLTVFVVVVLIKTWVRFRDGNVTLGRLLFWTTLWTVVLVVGWRPRISEAVTQWFGVSEPINLLLTLGVLFLFYGLFCVFVRMEEMRQQITRLVREIALRDAQERVEK